jgi:phage-related minor tail protein
VAGRPIKISILADGKQAKSEADDTAQSLTKSLGSALGSVKGLPALAAGTLVGGLLVKGFTAALDLEDARGLLQAQLGLTGPESAKAGRIAGDLYKEAYGESISDVNDALKEVFQSGLADMGDSEDRIKGISRAAFNASKVMGEELGPTTRAVSQILKTGLAKDANEAFDVLTRGQQLGINKSEDLLDTFNEYGTQFRKLGLSAKDSLGLMNQLIQGGARDSDLAADAIKEFSIRAIDGSALTAQGFKAIGLNAKTMASEIGKGGPAARAAFGETLTALNSIKDPVARNTAGVALFGTQWEDLGGAIKNANLKTAVASLGQVDGATDRAGDAMTTTKTKLTQLSRTVQQTLVEAIAKYALPKLNEFVSWFQGPGKFVIAAWAVQAASDILGFVDTMLAGLQKAVPGLARFGATAFKVAAAVSALSNPAASKWFLDQAKGMDDFADSAEAGLQTARDALKGWQGDLAKAKTKIEITADIADLDAKLNTASRELKDPKLTATRRAVLTADIAELERKKSAAVKALGDPALIKQRTAKLDADKKSLDAQIAKAKAELANKDLTRERRAKLNADITALQAKRRAAQADLNSLHGVTVPVTVSVTAKINAAQIRNKVADQLARYGLEERAMGGPVRGGRTYLVGENGPELVTMGGSGFVTPTNKLAATALDVAGAGGGGAVVINVYALADGPEVGRRVVETIREYEQFNGTGWRRSA